ncbi:MAG: hypothetical protein ACRDNZ_03385 [Streptosporangiaceae bacterium]
MLTNTLRNRGWSQYLLPAAGRRHPGRDGQRFPQAVYWRRRIGVLMVALAVLSLIAWACSGALSLRLG